MIDFLKRYWTVPIAAAIFLFAAFLVGRETAPGPSVVFAESIRFVEKKVEVVKVEKAKTKVVYRDVTTKPDGTVVDRSVEKVETETKKATDTTTATDGASDTKSSSTAHKPQWRVGALVGANVAGIRFDRPLSYDLLAAGAFAERRIIGPFYLGVWVLSAGPSFGLTLSGEF